MNTIKDINLNGKRVLIRVDYNVPLINELVEDDFRIKASLPTIRHCLNEGASVVLMSHLGRPKGEVVPALSLDPVAFRLEELLDREVMFSDDCISEDAIGLSKQMLPREVHLLENLRFHPGETQNDEKFSQQLSEHADIYVNDAFGTAHRSHASNVGVTQFMEETCLGFLMEKEYRYLGEKLSNPAKPLTIILGGAKISDKIELIENMLPKAQSILIGGAMAFTFLKVMGKNIGASLVEESSLGVAEQILAKVEKMDVSLVLPTDVVAAADLSGDTPWRIANIEKLESNEAGYDIGPETTLHFELMLSASQTIIWNGPMGVCEVPEFATGTQAIASIVRDRTEDGTISIIGGGDTASAIKNSGIQDGFSHISTGGGASLQMMSGKTLPAFETLLQYA